MQHEIFKPPRTFGVSFIPATFETFNPILQRIRKFLKIKPPPPVISGTTHDRVTKLVGSTCLSINEAFKD